MIIHIKHTVDWDSILQLNQMQTSKDNIRKNGKRIDHDYKFRDKIILVHNAAYKYEAVV